MHFGLSLLLLIHKYVACMWCGFARTVRSYCVPFSLLPTLNMEYSFQGRESPFPELLIISIILDRIHSFTFGVC